LQATQARAALLKRDGLLKRELIDCWYWLTLLLAEAHSMDYGISAL
jgi:hypothetical protein